MTGFGLTLSDSERTVLDSLADHGQGLCGELRWCYRGGISIVAVGDMETAYTDAAGVPNTDARINLGGGAIGGFGLDARSLHALVWHQYRPGTEVTFDARGNINAVSSHRRR
jgi:hypothetical protein